jgi:hypothetical protein
MHQIYKTLILIFTLLGFTHISFGQEVIGPFDVYVSQQGKKPSTLFSGSYKAPADEGRYVNVKITDIKGPIKVDPLVYELKGPNCPTYDSHGNRTPETPAAPNYQTFYGNINFDGEIPEAGTSVEASFQAKDEGYYTICSKNQQVGFPLAFLVKFKINSILIKVDPKDVNFCKVGDSVTVNFAKKFPETGGKITWASLNGKVSVNGDQDKCIIKCLAEGADQVVATYTVAGTGGEDVIYRDTVKINTIIVKFSQKKRYEVWDPEGKFKLKVVDLLTDKSAKTDLEITITDAAGQKITDETAEISFGGNPYYWAWILAKSKKNPDCVDTMLVSAVWYYATSKAPIPNDGEEFPFELVLSPADADPALKAKFTNIQFKSEHQVASKGNPNGKADLEFDPLTADWKCKVKNVWWYSTQESHCNTSCVYLLKSRCTFNGAQTGWFDATTLTMSIASMNGAARPSQTFTGTVRMSIKKNDDGSWTSTIDDKSTFARSVKGEVELINVPAASQFKKMVSDEENYHKGQIEGTNGETCKDLWDAGKVWTAINGTTYNGPSRDDAIRLASDAFIAAVRAENTRSGNLLAYPGQAKRCTAEKEAKAAVGTSHRFVMKCAYPACP